MQTRSLVCLHVFMVVTLRSKHLCGMHLRICAMHTQHTCACWKVLRSALASIREGCRDLSRALGLPSRLPSKHAYLFLCLCCSHFFSVAHTVLQGVLDLTTGQMDLEFSADFDFTVGSLYKAPSLKVATTLTSEHSAGQIHKADGQRLQDGQVK